MTKETEQLFQAVVAYLDARDEKLKQEILVEVRKTLEEQHLYPSGYCTRKQALHMLGCSKATLWKYTTNNLIGYVGSGQGMRFFVMDIKNYLRSKHVKAEVLERRLKEAALI